MTCVNFFLTCFWVTERLNSNWIICMQIINEKLSPIETNLYCVGML